jgi:hypothetical protein
MGVTCVTAVGYWIHWWPSNPKPGGGTPVGLVLGIVGTAMILFVSALGLRKRAPSLRIGRPAVWLRAHVWLGLSAFVVIVLHSGFSMGGPLTTSLLLLLGFITLSGLVGVGIQQVMPRIMLSELQEEIPFDTMDTVLSTLRQSADGIVQALAPKSEAQPPDDTYRTFNEWYTRDIRPYLYDVKGNQAMVANDRKSRLLFAHLRKLLPPPVHPSVEKIEKLVEQRRQLARQARLHYVLYGWLLVHVPLSAALLVLIFVHALMALRYT